VAAKQAEEETYKSVVASLNINISKLKNFKGTKQEEEKIVSEMNNTYGETMDYFKSVSEWYDALTKNSKTYCDQMISEAKIRRLANQIAEKEQENYDIIYNPEGSKRRYSTQRRTELVRTGDYDEEGLPNMELHYTSSPLEKAVDQVKSNQKVINSLTNQMYEEQNKKNALKYPVVGSPTAPAGGNNNGRNSSNSSQNKTRLQGLEEKIAKAKDEYVNTQDNNKKNDIQKDIAGWETGDRHNKATCRQRLKRPLDLKSISDIDKELSYQQMLLKQADSVDSLSKVNKKIDELNEKKKRLELDGHTTIEIDEHNHI